MPDYTWLDFLIIGIFIFNTLLGLARALLREIISIICVMVALVVAIKFTLPVTDFLNSSDGFKSVVNAFSTFTKWNVITPLSYVSLGVSFVLFFVGTYSIGEAVNHYVQTFGVLMFPGLALLDRLAGAVLGWIRGYIFNLILILVVGLTPIVETSGWSQSLLVPKLKPSADKLANLVRPGGFPVWTGGY